MQVGQIAEDNCNKKQITFPVAANLIVRVMPLDSHPNLIFEVCCFLPVHYHYIYIISTLYV